MIRLATAVLLEHQRYFFDFEGGPKPSNRPIAPAAHVAPTAMIRPTRPRPTRLHLRPRRRPEAIAAVLLNNRPIAPAATAMIRLATAVLLERQRVLVQPGYIFDLEGDPYLVVNLLTEPSTFAEGLRRLTDKGLTA